MKKKTPLSLLLLSILAAGPALSLVRAAQIASQPLVSPVTDDDEIEEVDPNAPDLRIVTATPRAAIAGRVGSVLTRARLGRTINAIVGETIRFVGGVKEAVWYTGAGRVESTLRILGADPNGGPVPLGGDHLVLNGAAPKIDLGRTRVDVPFPDLGTFPITAVVGVSAIPRNGSGVNRTDRVPYVVHVWNAGDLGEITGTVTEASSAEPLAGFRVVAIDPVQRTLVSATYTSCAGTYDLKRLPPDSYLVAVRGRRGFSQEFFDGVADPNAATLVAVSAGMETSSIDFRLSR
jgi:hypothetical protein